LGGGVVACPQPPQTPTPNPQSPIPKKIINYKLNLKLFINIKKI